MTDPSVVQESPDQHDATAGQPLSIPDLAERALPTPSTPGYSYFQDYKGQRWTCCTCVRDWLVNAQKVAIKRGLLKQGFDIWQLTGGATASAGTHSQGAAIDLLLQTSNAWVKFFRDNGVTGTWRRTVSQGFSKEHLHAVLRGCSHDSPCHYQLVAQQRGYNGLGVGAAGTLYAGMAGYGGKDPHADPVSYINWDDAVARFKKELAPVVAVATSISISLDRQQMHRGDSVNITAVLSPATAPGVISFEWAYPGSTTWSRFGNKTAAGRVSTPSSPGNDVRYVAVFTPTDATKYKPSRSAEKSIVVDDVLKMRADLTALKAQLDALPKSPGV